MKTVFTISQSNNNETTYKNVSDDTFGLLENAEIFSTEEEAQEVIENNEWYDWADVSEETILFDLENTFLDKLPSGHGHWKIRAIADFGNTNQRIEYKRTTDDSMMIDDAFNSQEGETSYYDSVEKAKEAVIDFLNR